MIKGYNPGSNITILDTFYQYPKRKEEGDGYEDDFISILYKDNDTGIKNHQIIYNPDYEYFVLNPNITLDHNLFFIEKDKVTPRMVPYKNLMKDIAEQTGNLEFFYNNIKNDNRSANERLHSIYSVFNSDMNINDHYRYRFDKLYKNEQCPISKSYFDIEVDTKYMKGDFPELGECPINAVSYIYDNNVKVFLLRNKDNPLIEELEKSINDDLFVELSNFIIENVGGIKLAKKYKVDNLHFDFIFFDEEICLIHDLFMYINRDEPDFLLAWNMAFDIPYIIERIYALGYDPKDFMCHPSFKQNERVVKYYVDEMHKNEYAERGDKYTISSYTIYLDQLIHFASRRKGQSAFPNFKLDTAANIITDGAVRKLDYSHITTNISYLPYLNFKIFTFYNIMDTIAQKCIEEEVNDINYIFGKCLINNTRYDKGHRQTVYLTNRATKKFYENGYIIGNNVNKFDNKKEKFEGALVGDPTHNSDYSKLLLGGRPINIVDNLDDYDFKSLYPSIDREFNMAPNTQIGKITIHDHVHDLENPFNNEFYDRAGQYIEDLASQNIISFCNRWLHYPSFKEWLDDLNEFLNEKNTPLYLLNWNHNDLMIKVPTGYKENLMTYMGPNYETPLMRKIGKPLNYREYLNKID